MVQFYQLMKQFLILIICVLFYQTATASWVVELFTGSAYSLPSQVTVRQEGYPTASKTAIWSTRPLEPAPYYSFRVGYSEEDKIWDLEMLHHKLYMDNTDHIFNDYRSTFGFNLFLLNRGWKLSPNVITRLGVGPVVSHPINTIRGKTYTDDVTYKLVGIGTQASIQFKQNIYDKLYFTQEIKTTYAIANLPINGGDSSLTNLALHGLFGFGYDF